MQRSQWVKIARKFPFWQCLLPWNCILGFFIFFILFGHLFESLRVHYFQYGRIRAMGLAFGILAVRQLWLGQTSPVPSGRRQILARLLLVCGYILLSFICLVDPDWLKLPDAFYLAALLSGVLCCVGGVIAGGAVASTCPIPIPFLTSHESTEPSFIR